MFTSNMTNSIKSEVTSGEGFGETVKAPYETKIKLRNTCLASLGHPSHDLQQ